MERDQGVAIRDLDWDSPRSVIFVHGDVDGMVTACVFLRGSDERAEIRFTGARRLARDLQALGDRIAEGLPVDAVLIGNVPVRPAAIGAIRPILERGVRVTWVDHHMTRQDLLDEVDSLRGLQFLHETEPESAPSSLAASALSLDEPHVQRLLQISAEPEADDPWLRDCHTLLCAQIGRARPDVLRRLALHGELNDDDHALIRRHLAREEEARCLVDDEQHPTHDIAGRTMVVIDARGREVGFLPRRVDARYGDVDLRLIIPDEGTLLLTSSDRSRDLVRLLRSLPWPAGIFVGGRPHHARIDPGPVGVGPVLDILTDPASWPADIDAASSRPPRDTRGGRGRGGRPRGGPPRGGPPRGAPQRGGRGHPGGRPDTWSGEVRPPGDEPAQRGYFDRVVLQRVRTELMEQALLDGSRLEVFEDPGAGGAAQLMLALDGQCRRVALHCSPTDVSERDIPLDGSLTTYPDACALWVQAERGSGGSALALRYRWFGGDPGEPLPALDGYPLASDDPPLRRVPTDEFVPLPSIVDVLDRLFGD